MATTTTEKDKGNDSDSMKEEKKKPCSFKSIESLETSLILDRYDGFILDQFGVMHNGAHALEGAVDCVQTLKAKGKKLVILSNSSSLSASTLAKIPKLGFVKEGQAVEDVFLGAVTSGEEACKHIRATHSGQKALWFTWKSPKTPSPLCFLKDCGDIEIVGDAEKADFILLHGCEVLRTSSQEITASNGENEYAENETSLGSYMDTSDFSVIDPILKACASRKLPMVCCNPDFIMIRPDGTQAFMPGTIAQRYEEHFKGSVRQFGKPHAEHFQACIDKMELPKNRVIHIGDSLHHDVAGANAVGIDSIFVTGGVHNESLKAPIGTLPSEESLQALFDEHGQIPTYVVPLFRM